MCIPEKEVNLLFSAFSSMRSDEALSANCSSLPDVVHVYTCNCGPDPWSGLAVVS